MTTDFDLHGYVGVRLHAADNRDFAKVLGQLGPLNKPLERDPDVSVRFVDRLHHGPLTYVSWQESAFDEQSFYLLSGRDRVQAKSRVPLGEIGAEFEIVCERGLPAVPLLLAIVNMTALARGLLPLHASAFVYEGRGILATGWAKGGKTEALLAFMSKGARYVGDEWVYLAPDGRMFGVPEPIRLWRWQIQQLPDLAARLHRSERLKLGILDVLAGAAENVAPRRRWGPVGSLLRRGAPVIRRQVNVRIPPERLFGKQAIALEGRVDHVVFVSSHDQPTVTVDPMDADELARRMAASLAHERHELMAYYRQFRFAFPERASETVERAALVEADLAKRALGQLSVSWLRHPYPCPIDSLFDPISKLIGNVSQR